MTTRKELKDQYKQKKTSMGVFQIRNVATNRVLIDHSTDMTSRWNRHKMELKFGKHQNAALQKDWNEQGEGNFVFEVLSELKSKDDEQINYQKELTTLQEMIIGELNLSAERVY